MNSNSNRRETWAATRVLKYAMPDVANIHSALPLEDRRELFKNGVMVSHLVMMCRVLDAARMRSVGRKIPHGILLDDAASLLDEEDSRALRLVMSVRRAFIDAAGMNCHGKATRHSFSKAGMALWARADELADAYYDARYDFGRPSQRPRAA